VVEILLLRTSPGECNCSSLRSTRSVYFGWVNISRVNSFSLLVDQSSPNFVRRALGEILVNNAVFRLSISSSVQEIFAIEVWSRPKPRQILDVSVFPNFRGSGPQTLYQSYHACLATRHVEKFLEFTPRAPKLLRFMR